MNLFCYILLPSLANFVAGVIASFMLIFNLGEKMFKKNVCSYGCAVVSLLLLTNCASMFNNKPKQMMVTSNKPMEKLVLTRNGMLFSSTKLSLPGPVAVPNGYGSFALRSEKGDLCPIPPTINHATWFNLLLGGIPGFIVDAATGHLINAPDEMYCEF
jgi:hypothetical protein